ncbi:MAG: hypothetical protein J0H34_12675 [Rhizobiales bacterium]|nr:hypothetical protein [Hyphomicrobiales bacterium]
MNEAGEAAPGRVIATFPAIRHAGAATFPFKDVGFFDQFLGNFDLNSILILRSFYSSNTSGFCVE